jgi:hypothetical protein
MLAETVGKVSYKGLRLQRQEALLPVRTSYSNYREFVGVPPETALNAPDGIIIKICR